MNTKTQQRRRPSKPKSLSFPQPSDIDRSAFTQLKQLPNIGPSIARDFRRIGVTCPQDLVGRDAYAMFDELSRVTGQRFDPCLLDTFISAVRFMGGERAKPWWRYTAERKRELKRREEARERA